LFFAEVAFFELLVHQGCMLSVNKVVDEAGEQIDEYHCQESDQDRKRSDTAPAEHIQQQKCDTEYQQEVCEPQYY